MRDVLYDFADRRSLRYCRRGPWVISANGATYQRACDGRYACPICSPILLAEDRRNIAEAAHAHTGMLFLTFSISHHAEPLARTLNNVQAVWSRAFSTGSWMSRYRSSKSLCCWVRAVETTVSESGWNPHIHAVFFFDGDVPDDAEDALTARWMAAAVALGHEADREAMRGDESAVVARGERREAVAYYLTEQNAIRQSRTTAASASSSSRTPGDLLHEVAVNGDADAMTLLREFHAATKGKHKTQYSRSFNAHSR